MAINFETSDPPGLLKAFKKAIDEGHVVTWAYDSDGDFYHTPPQWKGRGWLRPSYALGRLSLNYICNGGLKTTKADYGVCHGRFIESMLAHCDGLFLSAAATAMPTNADIINSTSVA
ncbi:hypothetical protein TSA1_15920 [Bradyrhizobium nitroreducens]|uniref:Uncharacterized protein n=1 Tax=Bradyrhizobium nitroreducens TaxID=709803 RepID=A0A2M6UC43_9BRAD|nr:hypothetical protein [Bradyrhizobium nitroreducens]PIT02081.1 hypothetical protein TSA1_15920 [Bradyrhizobium nitroreducens]